MTMVFESVQTEGIAQLSYMIGDDSTGTAGVVDPRPNVDVYLELGRKYGVSITHVLETHIHADFMSGSRELAAQVGSAKIYASGEENASYDFDIEKIRGGQRFEFGGEPVFAPARRGVAECPDQFALGEEQFLGCAPLKDPSVKHGRRLGDFEGVGCGADSESAEGRGAFEKCLHRSGSVHEPGRAAVDQFPDIP